MKYAACHVNLKYMTVKHTKTRIEMEKYVWNVYMKHRSNTTSKGQITHETCANKIGRRI